MIGAEMQNKPRRAASRPIFLTVSLALIIVALTTAVCAVLLNHQPRFLTMLIPTGKNLVVLLICLGVYLVHFLPLTWGRVSTHAARKWAFIIICLLPSIVLLIGGHFAARAGNNPSYYLMALIPIGCLIWTSGMITYSIPCNFISSLPLLLHYLMIALIATRPAGAGVVLLAFYIPLASFTFPHHRRLVEYWKPKRLPRIRATRAGFTLIELLIVVAIIAILSAGIVSLTGNTSRAMARQEDWRRAVSLAEDEIALLRAREALPSPGRHPIDPALAARYPCTNQAEVEVRPGPGERLREVRVNVRLRGNGSERDLTLTALLPAQAQAEVGR